MSVLISDCKNGEGMRVRRDFRSCSMKSITINTLWYVAEVNRGVDIRVLRGVLGKRLSHDHLTNSDDIVVSAYHEGIYFTKGGDGESGLLFIEL